MNTPSQARPDSGEEIEALRLALFARRMDAICDEMGATLMRSAFSPNIRDRLDFSCALFDTEGRLFAQAAHIPVHLGSMAYAMQGVVSAVDWQDGDMLVFNDPYQGGTHLPDVTLVAPVFVDGELIAFVANRAHHADIGAASAGSMPVSRSLEEEGLVISPSYWSRAGVPDEKNRRWILDALNDPVGGEGDFAAQAAANQAGVARLHARVHDVGVAGFRSQVDALFDYAARLARQALRRIPDGEYRFTDYLDDDGQGSTDLPIAVTVRVETGQVTADFAGTADQVAGNINCPLSVTAAAVFYVFRCLMPPQLPACDGAFAAIRITAPEGSLVNARPPAAVAAGNVETSSRIVDCLLGALAQALPDEIPAASQGTMNNVAMGARGEASWDYYETIGGGMGAGSRGGGLTGRQSHMTNTLNTPVEVLESCFPLRVERYAVRSGSGGAGRVGGGDGVMREYRFLSDAEITLLTERRAYHPWGLKGGESGAAGENHLNGTELPAKCHRPVEAGDVLCIATPGGGGWGASGQSSS